MSRRRALFIGTCLVLIAVALSAWAYAHLPPVVPTHWDASGHVNGYSSRFWAVALQPLVMILLLVLMVVLPAISPKGFRIDSLGAFNLVLLAIIAFLLIIYIPVLRGALGFAGPGLQLLLPLIGVLFIVIGNYMTKFKKNFFIGIRTPWTLASDEVWLRTHRLGGRLFIVGGLALIVTGLVTDSVIPVLVIVGLLVVIPTLYSYLIYARIEGFETTS